MPKRTIVLEPAMCGQECQVVRDLYLTQPETQFIPATSDEGQKIIAGMRLNVTDKPIIIQVEETGEVHVSENPNPQ